MDAKAIFELGRDGKLRLVYCKGFNLVLRTYLIEHPMSVWSTIYYVAECARLRRPITRQLDNSALIPGADFSVGHFVPTYDRQSGELSGVRAEYERGA